MDLLDVETLRLVRFPGKPPSPYAILSHTWHPNPDDEVQYKDIKPHGLSGCPDKPSRFKVEGCCRQAKQEGYKYVWIDSCCIDQTNNNELSTAINSMYRWYKQAAVCYVYMADVPTGLDVLDEGGAFSQSRWFQRGWTLQEMLAAPELRFYNQAWELIADKKEIDFELEMITGIPRHYLFDFDPATADASAAQRMSWAAKRTTTREEDRAYSLLGLFDVNFPMIYGEGGRNAFVRLQQAIMEKTGDQTILAWGLDMAAPCPWRDVTTPDGIEPVSQGIWASSPSDFIGSGGVVVRDSSWRSICTFSSGRLQIDLPIMAPVATPDITTGFACAYLNCTLEGSATTSSPVAVALRLYRVSVADPNSAARVDEYIRPKGHSPFLLVNPDFQLSRTVIQIRIDMTADGHQRVASKPVLYTLRFPRTALALAEKYPENAWRGGTAIMPEPGDPDIVEKWGKKWYFARLRVNQKQTAEHNVRTPSKDFVLAFMAAPRADANGIKMCLVVVSPSTNLNDVAAWLDSLPSTMFHRKMATVDDVTISVSLDAASKAFVIVSATSTPSMPISKILATLDLDAEIAQLANQFRMTKLLSIEDQILDDLEDGRMEIARMQSMLDERKDFISSTLADIERLQTSIDRTKQEADELDQDLQALSERQSSLSKEYSTACETVDAILTAARTSTRVVDKCNWIPGLLLSGHVRFSICKACSRHYDTSLPVPASDEGDVLMQEALFWAVAHGRRHSAELLMRQGANAKGFVRFQTRPLLAIAIMNGDNSTVRLLVRNGAVLDQGDRIDGSTALWYAISHSGIDIAHVLGKVEHLADSHSKNGMPILCQIVDEDNDECFVNLARFGLEFSDNNIDAAVVFAVEQNRGPVLLSLLGLERQTPWNLSKAGGCESFYSLLKCAATRGSVHSASALVSKMNSLGLRLPEESVFDIFREAIKAGNVGIIKVLVGDSHNRNTATTPHLMFRIFGDAIVYGSLAVVEMLIHEGFFCWKYALKTAVTARNMDTLKLLLANLANFPDKDRQYSLDVALFTALHASREDMAKVLLLHGADPGPVLAPPRDSGLRKTGASMRGQSST